MYTVLIEYSLLTTYIKQKLQYNLTSKSFFGGYKVMEDNSDSDMAPYRIRKNLRNNIKPARKQTTEKLASCIAKTNSETKCDSNTNSKLLLEKLHSVLGECMPDCRTCDNYILALGKHIQKRHTSISDSNVSPQVTRRLRRGRSKKQTVHYTDNDNEKYECEDSKRRSELGMETTEVKVEFEDFEFYSEQFSDNESPLTDPIAASDEKESSADDIKFQISNYLQDLPENNVDPDFGINDSNELETQIKPKAKTSKKPTFPCSMCPKKLSTHRHLIRHFRLGHLSKYLKNVTSSEFPPCKVCKRRYPDFKYLAKHMWRVHNIKSPDDPIYICRICKTDFATNTETKLSSHFANSHPGEKAYVCELCGLGFFTKCKIKYHLRIHTGEKPFSCQLCSENFHLKHLLTHHMRIHDGEGPIAYTCETCGVSYKAKKHLVNHRRTHTGEKPFMCEVCSKCFSVRTTLTRHMLTHKGERKFICEYCQKGFITRDNLKFHEKIHTGKKEIVCEICGKRFQWQHVLKGHMRSHER